MNIEIQYVASLPVLAASVAHVREREPGHDSASVGFVSASNAKPTPIYRYSNRPSDPGATPRRSPPLPAHMPLPVSGLSSAAGRPPLPGREELGSSPESFWFMATAPARQPSARGGKRQRYDAAEVTVKPRTRPRS
jgi:hypothetical protein